MSQITPPRECMLPGCPGQVAEPLSTTDSRTAVSNSEVFYGRLVVRDDVAVGHEDGVKHPAAAFVAADVVGIVTSTHAIQSSNDSLDPHYQPNCPANVMRSGYVWVGIDADVAIGDPVHVLTGAGDEGKFSNAGGTVLPNARWKRGGTATEGVAVVELKLV